MARQTGYKVYGAAAGGGSGVTYNQWTIFSEYIGPTSYTTGGFVIDLDPTYSSLNFVNLAIKTRGANLPLSRYEYQLNTPAIGQVTVKIMKKMYDRVTSVGNITNEPASVTVQASSGVASSSESAHLHTIDHDHASFASATNGTGGGQVLLDALGPQMEAHTHTLDLPNYTGNSGAGTSHNHTDNSIYQHQHGATHTATNLTSTELANATNLSGTTWYLVAHGVRV